MNSDGVTPETPAEPQVEYGPPMPPDYKQIAIVILVLMLVSIPLSCCCFCFGYGIPGLAGAICATVALLQSSSVSQLYMAGDFEAAEKASATVKKWLIASIIVPVIVVFLMVALVMVFAGVSAAAEYFQKNPSPF